MSRPDTETLTTFWLACVNHQIAAGIEASAASMTCLGQLYELDTAALKYETADAAALLQQCLEARSPMAAASLAADRWRLGMQTHVELALQAGELLGNTAMKLNQSWQQRMDDMNRQCASCVRSVSDVIPRLFPMAAGQPDAAQGNPGAGTAKTVA